MAKRMFTLWCANCSEWHKLVKDEEESSFKCPICQNQLIDVSNKKFMLIGYPVAESDSDTKGTHYYSFVPRKGKRWLRYSNWVRFNSKLSFVPEKIKLTNVKTDGAAGLKISTISDKGFLFSVYSKSNQGLSKITFDWEAIR